ncbi:MAG: DUF4422 domain-containing protein [Oscillospiraceae bacterium]|nr:DUF4422 domain-containing protein [Oscillospiraceae bacterium]
MPDIKIFVSRRIDIDSEMVDNPLYVPVRCGAVFDEENLTNIAGDDTGDNISERRMNFCEFTVQYWAWKNESADYYGLCHYRRYLSFDEKHHRTNGHGLVMAASLSRFAMKRYGLLDKAAMVEKIVQYDLVMPEPAPVARMPLPQGKVKTVRQLWESHDGIFFEKKVIDRMFELIDDLSPEYSASAREYFAGDHHMGYNCYIMCKPLFERLCCFQFPIMEAIEEELDTTGYTAEMLRTPGYVGEMLFGIFLYHVTRHEKWRVSQRQLVLFVETRALSWAEHARRRFAFWMGQVLRIIIAPFFPLGTKRRKVLRDIFYAVVSAKERSAAASSQTK